MVRSFPLLLTLMLALTRTTSSTDATYFPGRSATIFYRPPPSGVDAHTTFAPTSSTDSADAQAYASPSSASHLAPSASPSAKGPLDTIKDKLASALPSLSGAGEGEQKGSASRDIEIGSLGILHPSVLGAYELDFPCSTLEFDVEPFL